MGENKWLSLQDKVCLMTEASSFDVSESDLFYDLSGGGASRKTLPAPNKVPKVFMTNHCAFNCQYCGCRCSNEEKRNYVMAPKELAELAVKGARNNAHGIFLTSAVYRNPDYTQELINETLREIRNVQGYRGYLHAKVMPGADSRLIYQAGLLADRLSVNIELPKSEGYKTIAKQKNRENILGPMGDISRLIQENKGNRFAKSQVTQMMVGTMGEDDRTIIRLSEAMYRKYKLKRVYYTNFSPVQITDVLPDVRTPTWRRNRIYQADRLMALYGMSAEELAPEDAPFLEQELDPKTGWALRHPELFPVEVNTASRETLLRVPGIGTAGADKILAARRFGRVKPEHLIKMRISLKHSVYFLLFSGKFYGGFPPDSVHLRGLLRTTPVRPEQLVIQAMPST